MHYAGRDSRPTGVRQFLGVFGYSRKAIALVWATNRRLTVVMALLTLLAGLLPAATAYVARLVVDAVVAHHNDQALRYVIYEGLLVALMAACQRGLGVSEALLRAQLGQRVNEMILDKALTLELLQFENSEFYDKMTQARQQASYRPLMFVTRTFGLIQHTLSLISCAALMFSFSPWAVAILILAGLPAFLMETRFAEDAFRLFRWRSPETRQQAYLESLIAREDNAKEVMLFELGPLFLDRYRDIFRRVYHEDRRLTLRRGFWGYVLGLISSATFFAAYAWIVLQTLQGRLTLGEMTMFLLLFRQGQSAVSAGLSSIGAMYEDNLYISNLYEFLAIPVERSRGTQTRGPNPGDGVRFEAVSFTYPGGENPAVLEVSFHLRPGQKLALVGENGSGKTTLIKLLTRLYRPSEGRILLDGLPLEEWDEHTLRRRIGVIFQDFVRYQLLVGENVGAGDVARFEDEQGWEEAARRGNADEFIRTLPKGYATQLGRWFKEGRELSGGQWQKIALSRAFMRREADILVLDEPTAAMDAEAEAQVFEHVRGMSGDRMVILISHRFSTVRMADHIVVLHRGRVVEQGTHVELLQRQGTYARLFELQASGYR